MTYAMTPFGYVLALEPGDELIRCLIGCAREQEVETAVVSGLGSLSELEIGAAARRGRAVRTVLREPLETCALDGTLTLLDGEPFPRVHGSFARRDRSVVGGHVYQAVCARAFGVAIRLCAAGAMNEGRHSSHRNYS